MDGEEDTRSPGPWVSPVSHPPLNNTPNDEEWTKRRRSISSTLWESNVMKMLAEPTERIQDQQLEVNNMQEVLRIETGKNSQSIPCRRCEHANAELTNCRRQIQIFKEKLDAAMEHNMEQEQRDYRLAQAQDELYELRGVKVGLQEKDKQIEFLEAELKRANARMHKVRSSISSTGSNRSATSATQLFPPQTAWVRPLLHTKSASAGDVPKKNSAPLHFTRSKLSPIKSSPFMTATSPPMQQAGAGPASNNWSRETQPSNQDSRVQPFEPKYYPLRDLIVKAYLIRCQLAVATNKLAHAAALVETARTFIQERSSPDVIQSCNAWLCRVEEELGIVEKTKLDITWASMARPTTDEEATTMEISSDGRSAKSSIYIDVDMPIVESGWPTEKPELRLQGWSHRFPASVSGMSSHGRSISRHRPSRLDVDLGLGIDATEEEEPAKQLHTPTRTPPNQQRPLGTGAFESGFVFPPSAFDVLSQSPPSPSQRSHPRHIAGISPPTYKVTSPPSGTPGPSTRCGDEQTNHEEDPPYEINYSPSEANIRRWLLQIPESSGIDKQKLPTSKKSAGPRELKFPITEEQRQWASELKIVRTRSL